MLCWSFNHPHPPSHSYVCIPIRPVHSNQPLHLIAWGHGNHAPSQSRSPATHFELVPANPNQAAALSQASPPLHPCPPVSERGPATVVPAHIRTALARLGIKIACDLVASPSTAPCARALPSSFLSSHDKKCARIALEQIPTSSHTRTCIK